MSVGFHCAALKTPVFTKDLPQLHPCTIEETRKLASVRIHVERVIGLTRSKFKIFNDPVQITLRAAIRPDLAGTLPVSSMLSRNSISPGRDIK